MARAILTCPKCAHQQQASMPDKGCLIAYMCNQCGQRIPAKKGTCCVFCSYSDTPCKMPKANGGTRQNDSYSSSLITRKNPLEIATLGAGCFWGVEEVFHTLHGVKETTVGYMGGTLEDPRYEDVCTGTTGHTEVVQIKYDPTKIRYEDLLAVFWNIHDPTTLNRQGPDIGTQYRSAIFVHTKNQERLAQESKKALTSSGRYQNPITTEILPAVPFYHAEDYHQQYLKKSRRKTCA